MEENTSTKSCERANDLIAYLYNEASQSEAKGFEQHLQHCATCNSDFVAFSQLRESVLEWRTDSLSSNPVSPVVTAPVSASVTKERTSALVAIRQFFNFAPLWMKGAVAFAAALFCVVSALALAHLFERRGPANIAQTAPAPEKTYTAEDLKNAVDKEVSRIKLAEIQQPVKSVPNAGGPSIRVPRNPQPKIELASQQRQLPRRRPLSRDERVQLATDLRLITTRDEDDLDFLGDVGERLNK